MNIENLNRVQKLTISAMVMALYVVVMYLTQSFAFGALQVRLATSFYALSYLFPFLVLPLGLSNCLSNLVMGGLGAADIIGGLIVGLLTAGTNAFMGNKKLSPVLVALPIIFIPGLGVSVWLSYLLHIPYVTMALGLVTEQIIPGILGFMLVEALKHFCHK